MPSEIIPEAVTRFLAAQLGLRPDDLADYATREETRREHLAALRELYGFKMFTGRGSRDLKVWLEGAAETARSNEDLARRFVEQCRATHTILPGITFIERLCADALVAAERRVDARIASRLDNEIGNRLDDLLTEDASGSVSQAARVARVAGRLGALDDRLRRGPEGWRHPLALIGFRSGSPCACPACRTTPPLWRVSDGRCGG